ncbi:hypothetical protein EA462_04640 [Natrarchaeobius halalkaliphilus]|uniref:Uncharacterized protein n=1 Tax=Natrarchaeobius halalkaliphilus TaxID=1679091 RepID=A0A3N6P1B6_9EURY|nr:FxLYD domain-containing protein [Natrarchaeobius halalkaliphilus]RQG91279.1 hypothetical protein EA462_04640 [Natrarchaeobius halalkaliphilus]
MTVHGYATRRSVLTALCGAAAGSLGGCAGLEGGRDPSYEAGSIPDVDDERTAEEMTAATGLADQEPSDAVTPLGSLSLEDHEFVLEDGASGATVQGTVENAGDDRIHLVEIRVRSYDESGDQLGRYLDRTGDLDGGSRWSFEVVLLESVDDLDAYDVAVLGTPT